MDLTLEDLPGEKRKQIGKIAHIVAHGKNGPRADDLYPAKKLDTYDNWILLCGTHHDIVDTAINKYSVEDLLKMKKEHETFVRNLLATEILSVGFAELEVAASALLSSSTVMVNGSFALTPPTQKMKKNSLTEYTHNLLTMGLSRSREVGQYIEGQSRFDSGYPDRLKAGFREEYDRLFNEGIYADALFESMVLFASGNTGDFKRKASGLVILAHLFEICEVFEQ
ncbi:unnamed protein product [Rotaria magnacalcarata]|uniref:Uncharacterized protein n=1 Tax=Rotaria magnacalcarata TaxID=392030 RepID=A0A816S728_9BILA|nr:unnamed protein product [Rotaria magnacalcarata]